MEFNEMMITQFLLASSGIWAVITGTNQALITSMAKQVYESRLKQWWEDVSEGVFIDRAILLSVVALSALSIFATHTVDIKVLTTGTYGDYEFLRNVDGLSFAGIFAVELPNTLPWLIADSFAALVLIVGGSRLIHGVDKLARTGFVSWMYAKLNHEIN